MGLLTAPTCRIYLSVARSSIHCMDGSIIHGFFIIIHGQRPWTTSLSSIHGQRPQTTSLSSMGDFVDYKPYSCSRTFLSLLGWFLIPSTLLDMDDPYGQIADELISRYPINWTLRLRWTTSGCGRPTKWTHNQKRGWSGPTKHPPMAKLVSQG